MATYYISPAGNDTTGDGSSGNPWLTFSKFLSSSASGDTCSAANGTYTFVSGLVINNRNLIAANTGLAVFSNGIGVVWSFVNTVNITGIKFSNLTYTGGSDWHLFGGNNANFAATFTNCTFQNFTLDGTSAVFAGSRQAAEITTSMTFVNCLFDNIKNDNTGVTDALFSNSLANTTTLAMTGCTIYPRQTGVTALHFILRNGAGTLNSTIKNTIFMNDTGATITWNSGAVSATVTYSDFYLITSSPAGTGNITADPLFVDPANSNFNLRPTSPCLGTGSL